ncbi:hypothetical protein FisN_7Hu345 [Fistulifera solaris]|uniref:Uncharacterized protein n=1 Tax=Fistulifera solaris TaxID=1519565 RepID=A0A1Z5KRW5_FISSO|nr:hypothetical protein FisN_7Hu345 [Fistulifera solaris]|eukprot:GAX29063.1 hypothetical protein FisN_7Hu345 [Fistulifera solaris]
MLSITITISADEIISFLLCLALWLLHKKTLFQFIRPYKKAATKEKKSKKVAAVAQVDDDNSSQAATCDSTDYSGSYRAECIRFVEEIKWTGKRVNFASDTIGTSWMEPPTVITVVNNAQSPQQEPAEQESDQQSIPTSSSALISTEAQNPQQKERNGVESTQESLPVTPIIDYSIRNGPMRNGVPLLSQATVDRLRDPRRYSSRSLEPREIKRKTTRQRTSQKNLSGRPRSVSSKPHANSVN